MGCVVYLSSYSHNERELKMKIIYGLLLLTLNTTVAVGKENNSPLKPKASVAVENIKKQDKELRKKQTFKTYGLGISRIDFNNDFHKALTISSKRGRIINDTYKLSLFRNNNFYKHLWEVHTLSNTSVALDISPFTNKQITLGIGLGLGMNLQSAKLFSDFRKSFDFGFAYSLEAHYGINKNWLLVSRYSKHSFNTMY